MTMTGLEKKDLRDRIRTAHAEGGDLGVQAEAEKISRERKQRMPTVMEVVKGYSFITKAIFGDEPALDFTELAGIVTRLFMDINDGVMTAEQGQHILQSTLREAFPEEWDEAGEDTQLPTPRQA